MLQGQRDVLLQRSLFPDLSIHRGFKEANCSAFFGFRTIKRRFGIRDQGVYVRAVLRIDARTDRETSGYIVLVDANGGVQHREQPPAEFFRRGRLRAA